MTGRKSMWGTEQDRGDSIDRWAAPGSPEWSKRIYGEFNPSGTLHAMMGVPGSGKSTIADELKRKYNAIRISPDDIRRMLTGDPSNQDQNAEVFDIAHRSTLANLKQGNHVIFDATNTTPQSRQGLLSLASRANAGTHLHVVNPPLEMAQRRNLQRDRQVPADVIDRMHGELLDSAESLPNEGWHDITHYNR